MTTKDDHDLTLDNNPGLENQRSTPEGELMTAAGSRMRDPHGNDDDVTLEDDAGLEHDEATAAGRMMSGEGSEGSDQPR